MDLLNKKCVPCEGGVPPIHEKDLPKYLSQLKKTWDVVEGKKIKYQFKFGTFREAIDFVNKVADLAEEENHHPNITIIFNKVTITLLTHVIGGLSENDFILAAKIEKLTEGK